MTEEIAVEGNAVIGKLETYGIQLKDDLEMAEERITELKEEVEWLKANLKAAEKAKNLWMADALDRKKKADDLSETVALVRNILDETEIDNPDEKIRALRKIHWDNGDQRTRRGDTRQKGNEQ